MDQLPVIRGSQVTLRPIEPAHVPRLVEILSEPDIRAVWGHYDEMRARREFLEDEGEGVFVIESRGVVVGSVMFGEETHPDYRRAEIDVFVSGEHQNRGLGTEALRLLAGYLFDERGHHAIDIAPAVTNDRAIAVYKKVGFRPVGTRRLYERDVNGRWTDVLLMDLLPEDLNRGT